MFLTSKWRLSISEMRSLEFLTQSLIRRSFSSLKSGVSKKRDEYDVITVSPSVPKDEPGSVLDSTSQTYTNESLSISYDLSALITILCF